MKTHVDRQVKERPVLFNAEMVKAILDGRKTQTRRPIKRQPVAGIEIVNGKWFSLSEPSPLSNNYRIGKSIDCPFGIPGDRLWVRETWAHVPLKESDGGQGGKTGAIYKADGEHAFDEMPEEWDFLGKWKPSIHMPRWASRITLEITGVRVERLQDITEEDAHREGIPDWNGPEQTFSPKIRFKELWESIYKNWQQNPWVWVIEFKRL